MRRRQVIYHPPQVEREELKQRVLTQTVAYPDAFSERARALCEGLLARDAGKRMGFKNGCCDEIRAHPLFRDINWRKLNAGTSCFCSFSNIKLITGLNLQIHHPSGILPPPFVPDPKVVYAKSLDDVGAFSSVRGVTLEDTDKTFCDEFASGNIPIPWQEEMIEMGVYGELNHWGPEGSLPNDLRRESILEQPKSSTCCTS